MRKDRERGAEKGRTVISETYHGAHIHQARDLLKSSIVNASKKHTRQDLHDKNRKVQTKTTQTLLISSILIFVSLGFIYTVLSLCFF